MRFMYALIIAHMTQMCNQYFTTIRERNMNNSRYRIRDLKICEVSRQRNMRCVDTNITREFPFPYRDPRFCLL